MHIECQRNKQPPRDVHLNTFTFSIILENPFLHIETLLRGLSDFHCQSGEHGPERKLCAHGQLGLRSMAMAFLSIGRSLLSRSTPAGFMEDTKERAHNLRCRSSCESST